MDHRPLLLSHVLALVPFEGWSAHALSQAAKDAKLNSQDLRSAFPGGVTDCIDYFFETADDMVAKQFPVEVLAQMRVPDRIDTLIIARLEHLAPHKEAVRRAVAFRALPWNAPHACRSVFRTVDTMWRLAGDNAIDFSYYSKRVTLAATYGVTLIYWLNDDSDNIEKTKEFLKRRLADIAAFGKSKQALKNKFKKAV